MAQTLYDNLDTARSSSIKIVNGKDPVVTKTYGDNTSEVKVVKYDGKQMTVTEATVNLNDGSYASSMAVELQKAFKKDDKK